MLGQRGGAGARVRGVWPRLHTLLRHALGQTGARRRASGTARGTARCCTVVDWRGGAAVARGPQSPRRRAVVLRDGDRVRCPGQRRLRLPVAQVIARPAFSSLSRYSPLSSPTHPSITPLRGRGSVVITAASLSELLRAQGKGTDASNVYDEEVRAAASPLHSFWIPLYSLIPSPLLTSLASLTHIFMGMPPLIVFSYFMGFPSHVGGRGRARLQRRRGRGSGPAGPQRGPRRGRGRCRCRGRPGQRRR